MSSHFPIGILGQVWYLVVSIPDLRTLTYFTVCCFLENTISLKWVNIDEVLFCFHLHFTSDNITSTLLPKQF